MNFSSSFKDQELANAEIAAAIKDRLNTMGASGYLRLLWTKLKRICSDGSMDFGTSTGDWYDVVFPEKNSKAAPLLRSIYYNDGEMFGFLYTELNLIWYFIMVSCLITSIVNINRPDPNTTWLGISILGALLFELLFEAQARHLYSSLPIFVVYGCIGYFKLSKEIRKGRKIGTEPEL